MPSQWRRRVYMLAIIAAAFFLGATVKEQLGIEFSREHLDAFRDWVNGLGWLGPVVFIALIIFRLFIGLSSHLVLILGGLVFGAAGGMLWGSIGLLSSSLVLFYLARFLGTDWVERRFGDQYKSMLMRIQRVGAAAVFVITAHPLGILTPTHIAAGLVGLHAGKFALAVSLAAPIRAIPFVFLGTAVLDLTFAQSLSIAAGLLVLFALPLFHPAVRRWVWFVEVTDDKQ